MKDAREPFARALEKIHLCWVPVFMATSKGLIPFLQHLDLDDSVIKPDKESLSKFENRMLGCLNRGSWSERSRSSILPSLNILCLEAGGWGIGGGTVWTPRTSLRKSLPAEHVDPGIGPVLRIFSSWELLSPFPPEFFSLPDPNSNADTGVCIWRG